MSTEFLLPDLGEGIHEAEVLGILVKEGESIKEDQGIFEVETDKAVVEIPSPVTGIVEKIHVNVGQTVKVGMVMVTFGESKGAQPARAKEEAKASTVAAKTSEKIAHETAQPVAARSNGGQAVTGRPVPAAPATRRVARELGVDLTQVIGSGPAGRVMREDVVAFKEGGSPSKLPASPKVPDTVSVTTMYGGPKKEGEALEPFSTSYVEMPDFSKYGPVDRVPLRSIRRKIAQSMATSWAHIPHVTHCDEADITHLNESLKKHEKEIAERGGRLTLTVVALKAVASALKKYPQFNSSLDEKTGEIVFKRYYNIGIAVATERGLIVPVIRNVDQKSLPELAIELNDIARKTREGKIELDRLQGGTFTITNIGAIGGTNMVPMVNYPECAILGMARSVQKPVVRDGAIQIRWILPLAMSFDHRLADGAESAYFVRHVINCLEDPLQLLLEV
ncbi:MAG: 2-oxo acid dehydrogenase subunit E2 [Candidatus Obscuribacterales bacterium]|nr:2-oxo acid dehydrogenase subunit E2 [Candidatus Obscuribacterales bacterium]